MILRYWRTILLFNRLLCILLLRNFYFGVLHLLGFRVVTFEGFLVDLRNGAYLAFAIALIFAGMVFLGGPLRESEALLEGGLNLAGDDDEGRMQK